MHLLVAVDKQSLTLGSITPMSKVKCHNSPTLCPFYHNMYTRSLVVDFVAALDRHIPDK